MNLAAVLRGVEREAWIRFLVAIIGLGLAFAAAMSSTVFRREGNLIGTAVSASAALLIAGFIALYTVPYLARRVALERVRQAIDYEITREGAIYVGIVIVVGVAALNTNNNLLFIIVAAMLAAVLVSGVASAMILRGVQMSAVLPNHVFAQQPVMARVSVKNRNPFAALSVAVAPPAPRKGRSLRWEPGRFGFPPGRPPHRQWVRLPDRRLVFAHPDAAGAQIFHGSVYFPYVAGRQEAWAPVELNFPRRGSYSHDSFGLTTRFPFSFLRKTKRVELKQEMIVYPSVQPTDEFYQVLPIVTGEFEAFVAGRGYDLYRIRDHQAGDSARLVDWKASAKSGGLKVREFTREDERKVRIVFDNPRVGALNDIGYEAAVQMAASLAWHFSGTNAQLSFVAPGYAANGDVLDFLRYLALVSPRDGDSILDTLPSSPDFNIIVTAEARGTVPTALWSRSYILFAGEKQPL